MNMKEQKKDWYLSSFRSFEKKLNGEANPAIHRVRKEAMESFVRLGFPTTRNEEWKYTDVSRIADTRFSPAVDYQPHGTEFRDLERLIPAGVKDVTDNLLVCVNGRFSKELSSMSLQENHGVTVGSLADAMKRGDRGPERHLARYARYNEDAFTALSTAFLQDGLYVHVPDGAILESPIHLLFATAGPGTEFLSHPRILVITGKNSQAMILESYAGPGDRTYFTNSVAEVVVGENAVLEYDRFQSEGDRAFHVGTTQVYQERNSNLVVNSISLGGALVRNNVTAVLDGEGIECTLNGLFLAIGDQHIDNHTAIDHAKPHCNSHELYKGILAGKSRGIFNGKILVRKDAQKTDAKQTNRNLVLSDDATIDTKPQLEIYANDVKCTHGATIGQLDDEAVFYLRSRGISPESAHDMLMYAFASEVIDRVHTESLRHRLEELLHARLRQERLTQE
jgi:Fe-S cluster assembly protein SufD